MKSFVSGPAGRPRHMLREARAKCAADGRWRERGVHLPAIHLQRRGLGFCSANAAADHRLQTASGSGRGTDASFYTESFLGFSYNLFLQLKRCLSVTCGVWTTVKTKQPRDCDGDSGGETPACIPLKQVSESTSTWHR